MFKKLSLESFTSSLNLNGKVTDRKEKAIEKEKSSENKKQRNIGNDESFDSSKNTCIGEEKE